MLRRSPDARTTERHSIKRRLAAGFLATTALLSLDRSSDPLTPDLPSDIKIVAAGDSFTSGHANGDVQNRYEECFRDDVSYANQLAHELHIEQFINVACSGATPQEIIEGKFGEPSQLDALDADTDYVLLTMGANAVNISGLLQKCMELDCNVDDPAFKAVTERVRSPEFVAELQEVYLAMTDRAPNATIILVEYPRIIGVKTVSGAVLENVIMPLSNTFGVDPGGISNIQPYLANGLLEFVDTYIDEINAANREAIAQARQRGARVVISPQDTSIAAIPNLGKTFHLDPDNYRALAHPNRKGHTGMKERVMVTLAITQYTMDSVYQTPPYAMAGQRHGEGEE